MYYDILYKKASRLHFGTYLKSCREHAKLTQDQLVHGLYVHDINQFKSLDTSMLSKWERGIVDPYSVKQLSIVKYFQTRTQHALPCFADYSVKKVESLICELGMKNLLGKSKKLVLDFPSSVISTDDLSVYQVRNSEEMQKYLKINLDLDADFNHGLSHLTYEHFKTWAVNPVNSFYVCEYQGQFFGLLYTLRVKPDVFEKLMHYELDEADLKEEHFASFDEMGSNYLLSFFSMSDKAATILFIRYYAHLIANQSVIEEVGMITMMEDAKRLVKHMHFHYDESKKLSNEFTLQSYRADLSDFLAHEKVLKMIFGKKDADQA